MHTKKESQVCSVIHFHWVSFNPGAIIFQPGKDFTFDIPEGGLGEDHGIEEKLSVRQVALQVKRVIIDMLTRVDFN